MSQPPPGQGPVDPRSYSGGRPPQGGPPPGMPYPPMMPYPYPPPRSGGGGLIVLSILLGVLLLGSIALNVILFIGLSVASTPTAAAAGTIEEVVLSGTRSQKIAVVRLSGVIMDQSRDQFFKLLDRVEKDSTVKAMIVEIDSPGGGVTASDEIYNRVMRIKQDKGIPVVVSMASLAASGGYYVACAGDTIVAQRTTLTGSIGVLLTRYDLTGLGEKYGIKDGTIVSDGATFKDSGGPFKEMSPDEIAYFKSFLNDAFDTFKSVIKTGRDGRLSKPLDEIANGKIYSAQQALELGLVDQLGYLDTAISTAASAAGLSNPHVIRYKPQPTFFDLLGVKANVSGDVSVHLDQRFIERLMTPTMMYLWPGR